MLFKTAWLVGLSILIILSIVALWDVSYDTCQSHIPILLSRALTTDPYRGLVLCLCLLAVASCIFLNSVLIIAGFLGFYSAFLVSMFETNAHNSLILISAFFVMYECYPVNSRAWAIHWWCTAIAAVVCSGWLLYSSYGCATDECSECSWWYISEYVCFWSMYGLVYWRIPSDLKWHDKIVSRTLVNTSKGMDNIERKELLLF